MEEKDYIKDLFSEKLGNHSVQVNPELWSAIASKLPAASVVSSGISLTSKVLIGLGTAASITVATIFLTNEKDLVKKVEKTEKSSENISDKNNIDENKIVAEETKIEPSTEIISNPSGKTITIACDFGRICEKKDLDMFSSEADIIKENKIAEEETTGKALIIDNTAVETKEPTTTENKPKIIAEAKSDLVIGDLPNIFTPNNDKENDLFSIEIKGLSDFSISILNSENKIVFTSTDPNFKWDGKDFSENLVPTGNYFYFFTGIDSNKKAVSKSNMLKVHY